MRLLISTCLIALLAACAQPTEERKLLAGAEKPASNCSATTDYDEGMNSVCQLSCGVNNYEESDLVAFTEAKVGDITQCPVSGAVYLVKIGSPSLYFRGHTFHTCCDGCAQIFAVSPQKFVEAAS